MPFKHPTRVINNKNAVRPLGKHPNPGHLEALRQQKMHEQHGCCACCPLDNASGYTLELHHRHYENWGHESPEDVVLLCPLCHTAITSRFRFADRYVIAAVGNAIPRPPIPEIPPCDSPPPQSQAMVGRAGTPVIPLQQPIPPRHSPRLQRPGYGRFDQGGAQ